MSFKQTLRASQEATGSWLCVGLDPVPEKIPDHLVESHGGFLGTSKILEEFFQSIIIRTAPHCCSFKPNIAFFESFGYAGLSALENIISFIRSHFPNHTIILDWKRGDIGKTAAAYARAFTKRWKADAMTASPYLGCDTLQPFFDTSKGVIVICKTSNKGSDDFQDAIVRDEAGERPMFLRVANLLNQKFGDTGNLGLVVGATFPDQLKQVRGLVGPEIPILIPGIGSQGGDLEASIQNNGGGLAVFNSSSSVIYASKGKDYALAAAAVAEKTNQAINALR